MTGTVEWRPENEDTTEAIMTFQITGQWKRERLTSLSASLDADSVNVKKENQFKGKAHLF